MTSPIRSIRRPVLQAEMAVGETMNANHFDLTDRLCLVTGSSQGIGLALAHGMAAYGARVVLNGRDPDKLATAALPIRTRGTGCLRAR